ncbi:MAG: hypothetical protein V1839_03290 [archaeon]
MITNSYWHGTTVRRWQAIQNGCLNEKSPLADTLYLPVTFACRRAELESDDAVILKVCAPANHFMTMGGGCAARAAEQGDGVCYENKQAIPPAKIKLIDEIPYAEAVRIWHSKRWGQSYRKHLRQKNLENLMQNWR